MTSPTPPTARTYGWLALGTLAFILYGSLVPFEFRARPFDKTVEAFTGAMTGRVIPESRSDAVANMMLGIPLGFSLLGLTCVDRHSRSRELLLGALFLPACVAFSAAVEFAQLYCPTRTCAASDVLMQAIGVVTGMAAWILAGQGLTEQARRAWAGPRIGGSAGRLLVAYLALLACVQALPLDLSLSPKDVYKNLRDKVTYIPFGEFRGANEVQFWGHLRSRIETVALYLPVGLLAGCLPGRFWRTPGNAGAIFGLAFVLGIAMESIQLFVMSRTPSMTDVLVGAATVVAGWRMSMTTGGYWRMGLAVWLVLLLVANWQPFNFSEAKDRVEWLLFLPLEVRNPLYALQDLLTKLILFAPLGVAVACGTRHLPSKRRLALAAGVGLVVSAVIETGQVFLPSHTPSVTDVTLGGIGAWFGAAAASRAWGTNEYRGVSREAQPGAGVAGSNAF